MGVATLMIIACHAPASGVIMPRILSFTLNLGNYGVDIFLLLSGLGLSYSLSKRLKYGVIYFYKRRFTRLFIPYLVIYIPYCALLFILGIYTIRDSLLCLSALEYWLYHRGAWFVSLILMLYILSPLLFCIEESKYKWVMNTAIISVILILCNTNIIAEGGDSNVYGNILFALGRVPCFIIGMGLGKASKGRKTISFLWVLLLTVTYFVFHRFFGITNGAEWMLVPLFLTIFITIIRLCKDHWLNSVVLTFYGKISLESYLTNITLNSILIVLVPTYIASSLFYGRYLEYFLVIAVGTVVSYLVSIFSEKIETKLCKRIGYPSVEGEST